MINVERVGKELGGVAGEKIDRKKLVKNVERER